MKKLFKFFVIIIVFVFFCINLGWSVFVKEVYHNGGKNESSKDIKKSKDKGCFVEELIISPKIIEIKGNNIQIKEVWLEKQHDLLFIVSIIPTYLEYPIYSNKKEYNINFRFVQDRIPDSLDGWFFVFKQNKKSFAEINGEYFTGEIKRIDWDIKKILLTDDSEFRNKKEFFIKKKYVIKSGNF